ncbi:MAG: ADP-ribosylglycohydrolase family protein [Acidobacteria bacterium]|nr:ADP-ribosylglycohydrolase family protein [Acidobacteriota bacterium]
MAPTLRDRYRGALVGLAIGDALGMPAEFLTRDDIRRYYGEIRDFTRARPGHANAHLPEGSYTDDTQIAILVAESILKQQRVDPSDLALNLLAWYQAPDTYRAPTLGLMKACRNLQQGKPWNRSGVFSEGGAPAARMVPVALLNFRNPAKLREDARLATLVTHNHPKAIAGAQAMACAFALCLQKSSLQARTFAGQVAQFVRDQDQEMSAKIRWLPTLLKGSEREALFEIGTSAYAIDAVPAALFCFLKHPRNFSRAVLTAANAGEDADTVAALTGGLSGAFLGYAALPKTWVNRVENGELLVGLADELHEKVHRAQRTQSASQAPLPSGKAASTSHRS